MRINRERKGVRELGATKKPQIIPPTAHQISPSAVSPTALEVVKTLTRAGHEAYLVGGCVRDLLLGKEPKDFDVVTEARPDQVRELFRRCRLIGRRFRLAHVRVGRDVIDVATYRAAPGPEDGGDFDDSEHSVSEAGQITRDNVYGNIETDALRRDFTINALFYDPVDETVIDYVDGFAHMENRELVSIGDPYERFREDPVRMLRAIRFAESLELHVPDEIREAIDELGNLLHHVPPARMLDEVLKLFHSGHAQAALARLRAFGLFRFLFPFTEESFIDDEQSIAELGLRNTDQRIQAGKPVIPAFLFACMLWEPLRDDIEKLVENGEPQHRAFMTAMDDILRDQSQYISIPKRISFIVKDIWLLQGRLEHRTMKNVKAALAHKRFRAAYDFLLLRSETGEVSRDLADWWTRIQEVDPDAQDQMVKALNIKPRGKRTGARRGGQGKSQAKGQGKGEGKAQAKSQGKKSSGRNGAGKGGAGREAATGDGPGKEASSNRNGRNGKSSRRRRRRRHAA